MKPYLLLLFVFCLTVVNAQAASGTTTIQLYLVAVEDNGVLGERIGCNDSLVAVPRLVRNRAAPLQVALEELLSNPPSLGFSLPLYNALFQPSLRLERAEIREGEARIFFQGSLLTSGVCDVPRVQAQLEATARQFPTVERVSVFVNGTPLAGYLSSNGEKGSDGNPGEVSNVRVYLIATDDNGAQGDAIGCNDSVVAVNRRVTPTIAPLRGALEELFRLARQDAAHGGFYNVFAQSDLRVEGATIQNGEATIHLRGNLVLSGVCDSPRVVAQLEYTARQFPTVERVNISINGTPLAEVLSAR